MWLEAAQIVDRDGYYDVIFGEHHGIDHTFSALHVKHATVYRPIDGIDPNAAA